MRNKLTLVGATQLDIAELEIIQTKLVNDQPLTREERVEAWWGLQARLHALREKLRMYESWRNHISYEPDTDAHKKVKEPTFKTAPKHPMAELRIE
jgi:hypothetical protein